MPLKVNRSSNNVPFFPPGISHQKILAKDISSMMPQSVKQCKSMSRSKIIAMTTSIPNSHSRLDISKSTPDLKGCHLSSSKTQDHSQWFEGNLNLHFPSVNLTKSLDRLPSVGRQQRSPEFRPERPFYPPSKYPNIHDKHNDNIQRLIETRDKYKTPKSRLMVIKLARSLSTSNINKIKSCDGFQSNQNYGSLPNLNRKAKETVSTKKGLKKRDEKVYTRPNLTTSYFYPNGDSREKNHIMVQSLRMERSMVSLIGSGSLNRASDKNQYKNPTELVDIDDISISARKQLNSFSQDSLDGKKISKKQTNSDNIRDCNPEDVSLDSEVGISATMSPSDDDQLKLSSPDQCMLRQFSNGYPSPLQYRADSDQFNIDQVTHQCIPMKTFNSVNIVGQISPILIRNEFLENLVIEEKKSYGRDDLQSMDDASDQMSKDIVEDDYFNFINNSGLDKPDQKVREEGGQTEVQFPSDDIYWDGSDTIFLANDNLLEDGKSFEIAQSTVDVIIDGELNNKNGGTPMRNLEEDILKPTARFSRFAGSNDSGFSIGYNDSSVGTCVPGNNWENNPGHNTEEDFQRIIPEIEQIVDQMVIGSENESKAIFQQPKSEIDEHLVDNEGAYVTDEPAMAVHQQDSSFNSILNMKFSEFDQGQGDGRMVPGIDNLDGDKSGHRTYRRGDTDSTGSSANDLSWTGYDVPSVHRGGLSWLSSPELCHPNGSINDRSSGLSQVDNPRKPLCSSCHMPAYFMERISISNIIFHKSCFRCRKCQTHLNFNNCIIHHKRPYCQVHMRPKIARSSLSASTNKLSLIKDNLENKSQEKFSDIQSQKSVFYGGVQSAKTKFFDDATKANDVTVRNLKRITPPRQGVNYGIVESEPRARDPNVVACGDYQSGLGDDLGLLTQSTTAKETRAHFRQLQNKASGSKEGSIVDAEESASNRRVEMISVDTKSLRNRFLVASNDSEYKVKKINPSEEIQRLVQSHVSSSVDIDGGERLEGDQIEPSNGEETTPAISRNRAKEMKEKFMNLAQEEKPKQSKFKLDYGEGGIYESNPQEKNDDIIKHNYDNTVFLPKNTVKSGLQKIKDLQDIKSKGYQKSNTEPIKFEMDLSLSGVYESTPEQSKADSVAHQNGDKMMEFRDKNYTNEAKKVFLEKTKQEEEEALTRSTPHMIDIWKELCPDSGVFENKPLEQRPDVVKHNEHTERHATKTEDEESREIVEKNDAVKS